MEILFYYNKWDWSNPIPIKYWDLALKSDKFSKNFVITYMRPCLLQLLKQLSVFTPIFSNFHQNANQLKTIQLQKANLSQVKMLKLSKITISLK